MTTAAEIKRTFEQYETARLECQRLCWEGTEAEFDAACDAEIAAYDTFITAMVEFAGGRLTREDVVVLLLDHDRMAGMIRRLAA